MTDKPSTLVPKLILGIFILGLILIGYGARTTEEIATVWTLAGVVLMSIALLSFLLYGGLRTYYRTTYGLATVTSALSDAFKELETTREPARTETLSQAQIVAKPEPTQEQAPVVQETYVPPWQKKKEEAVPATPSTPAPMVSTYSSAPVPGTEPIPTGKKIHAFPTRKRKESEGTLKLSKYYKEYRESQQEGEESMGMPQVTDVPAAPAPVPETVPEPKEEKKEVPEPEEEKEEKPQEEEEDTVLVLSEDELEDDATYQDIIEKHF